MQQRWWWVGGAVVVGLVVLCWFWFGQLPQTVLTINQHQFTVEVARSDAQLQKGLSGRAHLAANEGMLFVFETDDTWAMWMKDMRMPLDILWLDAQKQVVHIEASVQPGSYPHRYTPPTLARYVLELPAGTTAAKNISVGSVAAFE